MIMKTVASNDFGESLFSEWSSYSKNSHYGIEVIKVASATKRIHRILVRIDSDDEVCSEFVEAASVSLT